MPALSVELRTRLEKTIVEARRIAEEGAKSALEALAVHESSALRHMDESPRILRKNLRARGRQLGDRRENDGRQEIVRLAHACAYEHWHRMLFARFLAENGLLNEPETGVAVSLDECRELARDKDADPWAMAAAFAQTMLPQIFRTGDPLLSVSLSREKQNKLESLLSGLDAEVFRASDSLGWSYQFWQTENKKKINASEVKIGADELPAVTQLFTEDYMVDFLLDNTLGAWWAGRMLASNPGLAESAQGEAELRKAVSLPGVPWAYLRFIKEDGWRPAAGTFEGWPKTSAELKCLDPCMGSGHFIVAMFERLVAMRMAEEKIDEITAVQAVIRDNLFGLEIDPRCTQIAAFNLALAAWRRVGYRPLPPMHLACSGLAPMAKKEDWLALAGKSERLRVGMDRLYDLFEQAAVLGSLIDPREIAGDLHSAEFAELRPLLDQALKRETEDDEHELAVTARGIAAAVEILVEQFTLVATNVPYLSNRRQCEDLKHFCTTCYGDAKNDLAVTFFLRLLHLCGDNSSLALIMSQYWLFKSSYTKVRGNLLRSLQWPIVAKLGVGAFETISGEVVNVLAGVWKKEYPPPDAQIAGIDVMIFEKASQKATGLMEKSLTLVSQSMQTENARFRIIIGETSNTATLENLAIAPQGTKTGDDDKWRMCFWEIPASSGEWQPYQTTVRSNSLYDGRRLYLDWRTGGEGMIRPRLDNLAVGKRGVAISQSGDLPATLYSGERFDSNIAPLIPRDPRMVPALWAYCSSMDYCANVRLIDQSLKVTNVPLLQVPFDLAHWQSVAAEKYPDGLPKPFSSDPTQWLFNGHPKGSDNPLHVAVTRLLGFLWPRQTGSSFPDCPALGPDGLEKLADRDGIVCIPSARGEEPAADRLRKMLSTAYGEDWKPGRENELIRATGSEAGNLDEWLRNDFFKQHCDLFHQRPFVWHIWDGRKNDGFHALVNYHKLAGAEGSWRKTLELLTHSYLNDWIARQREGVKRDLDGAEARLLAAQELKNRLEAILEGEPPFDIFVRWKPISRQPIGWDPDINDGVRMNIRPFMAPPGLGGRSGAGILRWKPNIKWEKDRGKEPLRPKEEYPWFWQDDEFAGNRVNDKHLTVQEKQSARRI
jgi:hypothetical protein